MLLRVCSGDRRVDALLLWCVSGFGGWLFGLLWSWFIVILVVLWLICGVCWAWYLFAGLVACCVCLFCR